MIFSAPNLERIDLEVITGIEKHRDRLRAFLATPRRWRGQLGRNLRARAVRGSNSIEGYEVSMDDALALVEGDESVDADKNTILEVTGYRNAMTYIQQLANDPNFKLDQSLLRSLHFMMLGHDLNKSPGQYRQGPIFVMDEDSGEAVYEGPDSDLVVPLMSELIDETRTQMAAKTSTFVIAAMAHLNLVMIHPFRDGNGRMARSLQTLVLARGSIIEPEFSSIEEWLGRNTNAYYQALGQVGQGSWHPENDTLPWVRFNLGAHHMQAQVVLERLYEADLLWIALQALAQSHHLNERTVYALFPAAQRYRVQRTRYQIDTAIEDATAGRDLRLMASAGLLIPQGNTRGRFYVGSPALREIYMKLRQERPKIFNPYDTTVSDLGPRRQVRTVTAPK